MGDGDTKKRILDAAEQLFGERGFLGTSLRSVTAEAGVNVAAVHYHFGSKEALLSAVIGRRIAPVNEKRLKLLDQLEASLDSTPPSVEQILETFLVPALELPADMNRDGSNPRRVIGRIYSEPVEVIHPLLTKQFGALVRRYLSALEQALPELPRSELIWRFHFMIGAMTHVIAGNHELGPAIRVLPSTSGASVRRMVDFLAAGFRATPSQAAEGKS